MDELIGRVAASAGVDRMAAQKAVAVIFDFLLKEGPTDKVQALLDKLPGADAVIAAAANQGGGGMGGIMGAGARMMAVGLNMAQIETVTRETIAFSREKAGEDAVAEVVGAIPGLAQFV